jgi:hypothetical protein
VSNIIKQVLGLNKKPNLGGFRVQTSVYGVPIPIVYGMARVAGNLIHMPAAPDPQGGGGKAGKFGAGAAQEFTAPLAIGLCEGEVPSLAPAPVVVRVWRNQDAAANFTSDYVPDGWGAAGGSATQIPWPFLSSDYPAQAVPYQSLAYVYNESAPLPNAQMPQWSWEVVGLLQFGPTILDVLDASPAAVAEDLLTNERYGANFDSARLGDWTDFEDYVAAAGLFCSLVVDAQRPARDWLNDLSEIANTAFLWSDGQLKAVPYGDVPLTGNGHSYTPNTTPLYDLGDNDFLPSGSAPAVSEGGGGGGEFDPIVITRGDPATRANRVVVECLDRDFDYNPTPVPADDQGSQTLNGIRVMPTLTLHGICDVDVARSVAQIRLQREQHVLNEYHFRLPWKYIALEPMDLVTLTDTNQGLVLTPVRIKTMTETDDGFDVVAEDWPFGTASATLYGTGTGGGGMPDTNVDPGNTATPIIVEGPTALVSAPMELWMGASGGADWGGCDVWISSDGTEYVKYGQIVGAAAYGTLTATLATFGLAYPNQDTTSTLSVDISASGRTLATLAAGDYSLLAFPCYVEGASSASPEWLEYRNAALTSPGHYNLTTMFRGLYGSTINSHASGKKFLFVDSAVGKIGFPQGKAGQTIYIKLPAFNKYGAALQDVASVSPFTYVIGGDPVPRAPANPQGTVSIDSNGNWGWSADFPGNAQSIRWSSSTAGYPSDASTASGGALVNLGAGHVATVNSAGTLAFGQTIFITIVPFSSPSGAGNQLQAVHIRGSYLSYTASKTANYAPSSYNERGNTPPYGFTQDAQNNILCAALPAAPPNHTQTAVMLPLIPSGTTGVTITQFALDLWDPGSLGGPIMGWNIYRKTINGGSVLLGTGGTTPGLGWQTKTAAVSENTLGRTYEIDVFFTNTVVAGTGGAGNVAITYTMSDPKQTL